MGVDWVTTLYGYNRWANQRILAAASLLTAEEYAACANVHLGSLQEILLHTLDTHQYGLALWLRRPPAPEWTPDDGAGLPAIAQRWAALEQETAAFAAGLDAAQLDEVISRTSPSGWAWSQPRWALMLHQANHATQHRSEAAYLLTERGRSPGDLDLPVYLRQHQR